MKVIVIGPRGKMGKLITQVAASRDDMELVGAITFIIDRKSTRLNSSHPSSSRMPSSA